MKIIILSGGGGARLFPLSRTNFPKQFLNIDSNKTLLGITVERFLNICEPKDLVIVTDKKYYYQVQEEIEKSACKEAHVVSEPCSRNTAAAIALGVKYCKEVLETGDAEVFFVAPSDHIISPVDSFAKDVLQALEAAKDGGFITLGAAVTRPETGYGYISIAGEDCDTTKVCEVARFVEKPDEARAMALIAEGNCYWNSGMLAFRQDIFEAALEAYLPTMAESFSAEGYKAFEAKFSIFPSVSMDYAVLEKAKDLRMLPLSVYWNDVGTWDLMYDYYDKDALGNVVKADAKMVDCKNTMLVSDKRLVLGIGLEDVLVIDTEDVVLVSKRGDSRKIRDVYEEIQDRNEAHDHTICPRPWGTYQILSEGEEYKVKKIRVFPGQKLSLQSHEHRSEHWVVIHGEATVIVGGDDGRVIRKNESIYVPKQTKHRLMNFGSEILEIIEVQNGSYVGEDDITRYDDIYTQR